MQIDEHDVLRALLRIGEELRFQRRVFRGRLASAHGPGSIAFLGGDKLNLEEQYLFQKLARGVLGSANVDARTRHAVRVSGDAVLRATGGGLPALTLDELVAAAEVLVLGEDLQGEAPFAQAQIIRGQHQRGLHVTVAHPRQVKLARGKFRGDWLAVRPGAELAFMNALTFAAIEARDPGELPAAAQALRGALAISSPEATEAQTGVPAAAVRAAAKRLCDAPRKAVLFGRAFTEHGHAAALIQAVENLGWASGALTAERSSVMFIGPQQNSQGALDMGLTPDRLPGYVDPADASARKPFEQSWGSALPAMAGLSAPEVLAAAAEGRVKALWIVGDEWLASAPDRSLAERAMEKCELVIVNEMFLTETAKRAHVVFPVVAFAEKEGTVVNCERRAQRTARALSPRRGSRADWTVFQAVARGLGATWAYRTCDDVLREIARLVPGYGDISPARLIPDGATWATAVPRVAASLAVPAAPAPTAPAEGMWLLSGGTLFAQGSLSHRSATLAKLAGAPRAWVHPDDARRLSLVSGDALELAGPSGSVTLEAALDEHVPTGSVFVPYAQRGADLNRLGSAPAGAGRVRVTRRAAATVGV